MTRRPRVRWAGGGSPGPAPPRPCSHGRPARPARTFVERRIRLAASDLPLIFITLNMLVSGVLDWSRGTPTQLPLPKLFYRWHLDSGTSSSSTWWCTSGGEGSASDGRRSDSGAKPSGDRQSGGAGWPIFRTRLRTETQCQAPLQPFARPANMRWSRASRFEGWVVGLRPYNHRLLSHHRRLFCTNFPGEFTGSERARAVVLARFPLEIMGVSGNAYQGILRHTLWCTLSPSGARRGAGFGTCACPFSVNWSKPSSSLSSRS
jgi:hypothetical protein